MELRVEVEAALAGGLLVHFDAEDRDQPGSLSRAGDEGGQIGRIAQDKPFQGHQRFTCDDDAGQAALQHGIPLGRFFSMIGCSRSAKAEFGAARVRDRKRVRDRDRILIGLVCFMGVTKRYSDESLKSRCSGNFN